MLKRVQHDYSNELEIFQQPVSRLNEDNNAAEKKGNEKGVSGSDASITNQTDECSF